MGIRCIFPSEEIDKTRRYYLNTPAPTKIMLNYYFFLLNQANERLMAKSTIIKGCYHGNLIDVIIDKLIYLCIDSIN